MHPKSCWHENRYSTTLVWSNHWHCGIFRKNCGKHEDYVPSTIPVSFFPSPFTLYLLHFILKQVTSLVLPNQSISSWGIPHMTVSSHAEKKSTRRMADKLYSLWPLSHRPPVLIQPVKNGFCILKWLRKKKSKRSIVFSDTWNYIQFKFQCS